jgi:hypothetical protein
MSMPNSELNKYDGHNYTVSINFNRPQQSKGKRKLSRCIGTNALESKTAAKNSMVQNNNFLAGEIDSPDPKNQRDAIIESTLLQLHELNSSWVHQKILF